MKTNNTENEERFVRFEDSWQAKCDFQEGLIGANHIICLEEIQFLNLRHLWTDPKIYFPTKSKSNHNLVTRTLICVYLSSTHVWIIKFWSIKIPKKKLRRKSRFCVIHFSCAYEEKKLFLCNVNNSTDKHVIISGE